MPSQSKILFNNVFGGLNQDLAPDLIEDSQFSDLQNLCGGKGKLCQPTPLVGIGNLGLSKRVKLVKPVLISSSTKSRFASTFAGSYAYLILSDTKTAHLINPEDETDLITVKVFDLNYSGTPVSEGLGHGYLIGVNNNTTNASYDSIRIRTFYRASTETYQIQVYDHAAASWDVVETDIPYNTLTPVVFNYTPTGGATSASNGAYKWHTPSSQDFITGASATWELAFQINYSEAAPVPNPEVIASWNEPCSYCYIGDDLYFSWYNKVYYFNGDAIVAAGSCPMAGRYVANYYNHLFVGQHEMSDTVNLTAGPEVALDDDDIRFTVSWSDLNDPNNFYQNNASEADTFILEKTFSTNNNIAGITAMEKHNDKLYIFTSENVFEVSYVGLPLVMQIRNLYSIASCGYSNSAAATPYGIVTLSNYNELLLFNGSSTSPLSGIDFDGINITGLSEVTGTDFVPTYKSSRFPGHYHFSYSYQHNKLLIKYFLPEGAATSAFTYNVKIFELVYDFGDSLWFKNYLGGSEVVLSPAANIAYPCLSSCEVIKNTKNFLMILGDKIVTQYTTNTLGYTIDLTDIVEDSFDGSLTNKATEIAFKTKKFLVAEPYDYAHLRWVRLELTGTGTAQITIKVNSWDDSTKTTFRSESFTETILLTGTEPVVVRPQRRVKYFEFEINIVPSTYIKDYTINAFSFNTSEPYNNVQS